MAFVLSPYSLTTQAQQQFGNQIDTPCTFITLAELHKLSWWQLWRRLRSMKQQPLYLIVNSENSRPILSILKILACFTGCSQAIVIDPTLQQQTYTKLALLAAIPQLGFTSFISLMSALRSHLELRLLQRKPRLKINTHDNDAIVYLNANLWYGVNTGGSVGHIAGVINALAKQNDHIHYAALYQPVMFDPNINIITINPLQHFSIPNELNYYRCNYNFVTQLQSHIAAIKPKFIYQRMSIANFSGVLLSRRFKIPLVLEYNGPEVWVAKHWGKGLRFANTASLAETICLRHAHLIVTISNALRDDLIAKGIEPKRIVCYPNCVDPQIFNPQRFDQDAISDLRQQYQLSRSAKVLTFIGTFGKWHGVDVLAKVIRELIDKHRTWLDQHEVRFMLVGDGINMALVKQILNQAGDDNYVICTGLVAQDQAPLYLAAADILMSPHIVNPDGSRFFGSPTKLFEYMAMGKAIIASDLEQIGEVLKNSLRVEQLPQTLPDNNSELAVLTEPGNTRQLLSAIKFVIENPQWQTTLGQNARNEVLAKYTWDKHVAAILHAFN